MTRTVDENARRQAELWFARRLEPSVRDSGREAFEHWRQQNPQNARAYAETERLWNHLAALRRSERLQALVPPAGNVALNTQARRSPFLPFLLAASLAAVAIFGVAWFTRGPGVQTFATALGEQRTEVLTDGTTMRLNTSSTIEVRMGDRRRDITLKNGEAAFDVAKDAARPFVVSAGDGTITAVGTHFQVRHEGGKVAVTLIEGRVQLARTSHREIEWLQPGQQATFSEGAGGIVRRNVDAKLLTSWASGRLEFRSTPLEQAVAEANRYSARKIRIGDPAIRAIEVSGTFRTGDVDGVAAAFAAAFPVRGEIGEDEIVLFALEAK